MTDHELVQAEQDIVHVPEREPVVDFGAMLTHAKEHADFRKKLLPVILSVTYASDWVNFGGKARITEDGALRIRSLIGVSIVNIRKEKLPLEDNHYMWRFHCDVEAKNFGRLEDVIGTCGSKDKFFAMSHGELRPVDTIDSSNIEKKARANMVVNAIQEIAGLKGIPWEVIAKGGVKKEDVAGVEFKKDKTSDLKKKLGNAILKYCEGDKDAAADVLYSLTKFTTDEGEERGAKSLSKMSAKWVQAAYGKAKEDQALAPYLEEEDD